MRFFFYAYFYCSNVLCYMKAGGFGGSWEISADFHIIGVCINQWFMGKQLSKMIRYSDMYRAPSDFKCIHPCLWHSESVPGSALLDGNSSTLL